MGMKTRLVLLFGGLLLPAMIYGQVTSGAIIGSVVDPADAVVANARVTARNLETNATSTLATGHDGRFRFPQLPVGSYQISVEAPGFGKLEQGPIVLRLNQIADLTLKLSLSTILESVNITADAPLINTTTAEVGVNFDV